MVRRAGNPGSVMSSRSRNNRRIQPHHGVKKPSRGGFDWVIGLVFGNVFSFIGWALSAIFIAIIIEWVGMAFWWEMDHSRRVLEAELQYLNGLQRNLLLSVYPADLAEIWIKQIHTLLQTTGISGIHRELLTSKDSWVRGAGMGLQSAIDVTFLFCVRLAICVSAVSGFILIGLLAFLDGLTEREIRKNCGGHESALVFHHAKRWLIPSVMMALGFYLTVPFSIHPSVIFIPAMALTGMLVFTAASKFKKYL
jgi:integrating conjugative element membrane protein (TIGR03747 family)